jgi:hypothetical protein
MDGRGEVYVRHLGIVREYAAESAFDRSFIYHKYKPILYAFDTLDVDHVVIRVQNTLGMRHGRIRVHQVRRRDVLVDTAVV